LNYDFNVELKNHFFFKTLVKSAKTDLTIPEYLAEISAAVSETMRATDGQFSTNQSKTELADSTICGV